MRKRSSPINKINRFLNLRTKNNQIMKLTNVIVEKLNLKTLLRTQIVKGFSRYKKMISKIVHRVRHRVNKLAKV